MAFPKSKLLERIERFQSFILEQEVISSQKIDSSEKGKHRYIVWSDSVRELAMVTFAFTGGIELTAPAGQLKETILTFVAREAWPCHDRSGAGELAQLDAYHYLLATPYSDHDSTSFPLPGSLQMTTQDNPLVELAELLGYGVYLLPVTEPLAPRYAIVTAQEVLIWGNKLPEMLAQLLTGHAAGEEMLAPPYPRKTYLPRNARYRLAYLRLHTKWNGAWMTQKMLADLAGISESTVKKIESEHRRPEQSHVYLSTAKSILAVLNEAREREGQPLIQLWNINWTTGETEIDTL